MFSVGKCRETEIDCFPGDKEREQWGMMANIYRIWGGVMKIL